MAADYVEVLESFPGNSLGKDEAWDATEKYAKIVVGQHGQDRFAVGVRALKNEIGQRVYAVVLVERKE